MIIAIIFHPLYLFLAFFSRQHSNTFWKGSLVMSQSALWRNLSQVSENTRGHVATLFFLPPPSEHGRSNKASILARSRQHVLLWRPVNKGLNTLFAGLVCFGALENKKNEQLWDFCECEIFPKNAKNDDFHTLPRLSRCLPPFFPPQREVALSSCSSRFCSFPLADSPNKWARKRST